MIFFFDTNVTLPQTDQDTEFKTEARILSSAGVRTQKRGISAQKLGYSGLERLMNLFRRLFMLVLLKTGLV